MASYPDRSTHGTPPPDPKYSATDRYTIMSNAPNPNSSSTPGVADLRAAPLTAPKAIFANDSNVTSSGTLRSDPPKSVYFPTPLKTSKPSATQSSNATARSQCAVPTSHQGSFTPPKDAISAGRGATASYKPPTGPAQAPNQLAAKGTKILPPQFLPCDLENPTKRDVIDIIILPMEIIETNQKRWKKSNIDMTDVHAFLAKSLTLYFEKIEKNYEISVDYIKSVRNTFQHHLADWRNASPESKEFLTILGKITVAAILQQDKTVNSDNIEDCIANLVQDEQGKQPHADHPGCAVKLVQGWKAQQSNGASSKLTAAESESNVELQAFIYPSDFTQVLEKIRFHQLRTRPANKRAEEIAVLLISDRTRRCLTTRNMPSPAAQWVRIEELVPRM